MASTILEAAGYSVEFCDLEQNPPNRKQEWQFQPLGHISGTGCRTLANSSQEVVPGLGSTRCLENRNLTCF